MSEQTFLILETAVFASAFWLGVITWLVWALTRRMPEDRFDPMRELGL